MRYIPPPLTPDLPDLLAGFPIDRPLVLPEASFRCP